MFFFRSKITQRTNKKKYICYKKSGRWNKNARKQVFPASGAIGANSWTSSLLLFGFLLKNSYDCLYTIFCVFLPQRKKKRKKHFRRENWFKKKEKGLPRKNHAATWQQVDRLKVKWCQLPAAKKKKKMAAEEQVEKNYDQVTSTDFRLKEKEKLQSVSWPWRNDDERMCTTP